MPQTIIELESRSSIELDFEVVFQAGEVSLLPHVEERGLVFVAIRRGKVVVSAGAFVGLVPLTGRLTLEIVPKLPVLNLSRIFETARGSLGSLRGTPKTYLVEPTAGKGVLQFVVDNLVDAVREVERDGYEKSYLPRQLRSGQLRGRLNIRETMGRCWSRGLLHQVVTERHEQTTNTLANRVIKTALRQVLDLLPTDQDAGRALQARAAQCFLGMPEEIGLLTNLERQRLPHFRGPAGALERRYERALNVALMLLAGRGISLDHPGADSTLNSYILNLEEIFEDYLRFSIGPLVPTGCRVKDGNADAKRPLFREKANGPFAQPDIVVVPETGPPVIVEVKYKTKVDRADINQAVTYAVAYGTKRVVVLHVSPVGAVAGPYLIGHVGDVEVTGFGYDLGSADLEREEAGLASYLVGLTTVPNQGV